MTGTWCITCVSRYRFCRVSDNKNINIGRLCTFRQHLIKHWAPTQKVVTLSPGEAELYGVVKGATEALGLRSLAQDMGVNEKVDICLYADSSAGMGICQWTGIGKVRHLATGQLWIQEKIRHKEISLYKVLGTDNPADLLTKHVPRDSVDRYI